MVALKCFPKSHNVTREVRIMGRLHHPHILRFIELLSSPSFNYIVLDLAKRGDFFTLLQKRGRFPEDVARHYFHQLISAVAYCHSHGVIHRDLKLGNLLLDDSGNLLLCDFGLASDAGPRAILHTFCGTAPYMAPEIHARKPYSGAAADIWACGAILFVLTAGSFPSYDSQMECGGYRCPWWMSEELRRLISRLLDPNPGTRATIEDIIDDPWFCLGLDKKRWEMMTSGYSDEEVKETREDIEGAVEGSWWRIQGQGGWWRRLVDIVIDGLEKEVWDFE